MSENVVLDKSYKFALRIVKLFNYLTDEKKEFVLSKALLTAGTNVGAHVKAAQEAESKQDFYFEMSAALKNASKTEYWLQLLYDGQFLDDKQFTSIHADCEEIIRLTKSITRPTRRTPDD
ncbi:MAG: four helix bundle protein [Blastocatellales bacterium]